MDLFQEKGVKLRPRYYQQDCFDAIKSHVLHSNVPTICDLATGAGKSIIIAMVAEWLHKASKRVLVLTHSSDLVRQNHAKYAATGAEAGIFSAKLKKKQTKHHVLFAGVQSVVRSLDKFEPVSMIIVDEAHIVSDELDTSYQKVFAHFFILNPNVRIIGLTATPSRGKYALVHKDHFFKKCLYRIGTKQLIDEGYLSPITYGAPKAEEYQLAGVKLNSLGFLDQKQVDAATVGQERLTRNICLDIMANMEVQGRNLCMIFASSIMHAKEILSYLPEDNSELVTGETSDRTGILERAKSGGLKYLVSVGTLTTGVDLPICDCVALLRATESPTLLMQIIGRGLRLSPETGKIDCLLLDYGQNIERHGEAEDDIFSSLESQKAKEESEGQEKMCPACSQLSSLYARRCKNMALNDKYEMAVCNYRFEFKTCPSCDTQNDLTARNCWQCKHELIDPNAQLTNDPHMGKIDALEPFDVISTLLKPHKKDDKTLLRAEYTLQSPSGATISASEYFHDQHESPWVMKKFKDFCSDISASGQTVEEVLASSDELKGPAKVSVKRNGKYWNVIKRHKGESTTVTIHKQNSTWQGF